MTFITVRDMYNLEIRIVLKNIDFYYEKDGWLHINTNGEELYIPDYDINVLDKYMENL